MAVCGKDSCEGRGEMEESGRQATGSALKQHTHTLNPHTHTHVLVVANLKIIIKNVKKNERETREFDWGL